MDRKIIALDVSVENPICLDKVKIIEYNSPDWCQLALKKANF